jgi:hypothetical protein
MALIKDIRAIEWVKGNSSRWCIQVMMEGSRKWVPIKLVRLKRKPVKKLIWR